MARPSKKAKTKAAKEIDKPEVDGNIAEAIAAPAAVAEAPAESAAARCPAGNARSPGGGASQRKDAR